MIVQSLFGVKKELFEQPSVVLQYATVHLYTVQYIMRVILYFPRDKLVENQCNFFTL